MRTPAFLQQWVLSIVNTSTVLKVQVSKTQFAHPHLNDNPCILHGLLPARMKKHRFLLWIMYSEAPGSLWMKGQQLTPPSGEAGARNAARDAPIHACQNHLSNVCFLLSIFEPGDYASIFIGFCDSAQTLKKTREFVRASFAHPTLECFTLVGPSIAARDNK